MHSLTSDSLDIYIKSMGMMWRICGLQSWKLSTVEICISTSLAEMILTTLIISVFSASSFSGQEFSTTLSSLYGAKRRKKSLSAVCIYSLLTLRKWMRKTVLQSQAEGMLALLSYSVVVEYMWLRVNFFFFLLRALRLLFCWNLLVILDHEKVETELREGRVKIRSKSRQRSLRTTEEF